LLTDLRDIERRTGVPGTAAPRPHVLRSPRAEARARRGPGTRRHRPVFVDDTGRRRRAARLIGTTVGLVALVYVGFVGLTFAGLPGLDGVDVAGLGSLTAPAGEDADVGTDPVEQVVPEVVADADHGDGPAAATAPDDGDQPAAGTGATTIPATTTTAPAATTTTSPVTTTVPGNGPGTAVPGPNSTVPDKGGPPTSRPGNG
jgi:hypothetical protein